MVDDSNQVKICHKIKRYEGYFSKTTLGTRLLGVEFSFGINSGLETANFVVLKSKKSYLTLLKGYFRKVNV